MKHIKVNDKVTIKKPGHLTDGMQGDVISNDPEFRKPLKVDLGDCGVWQLSYEEIHEPAEEKATEGIKMVWEAERTPSEPTDVAKTKRPYKKKSKDEPVKPKRKYSPRKPKTN